MHCVCEKKQHELQHPQFKWILSLFQCQLPEEFINKLKRTEKNTLLNSVIFHKEGTRKTDQISQKDVDS